jgi:hypothetical protein
MHKDQLAFGYMLQQLADKPWTDEEISQYIPCPLYKPLIEFYDRRQIPSSDGHPIEVCDGGRSIPQIHALMLCSVYPILSLDPDNCIRAIRADGKHRKMQLVEWYLAELHEKWETWLFQEEVDEVQTVDAL